MTTFYICRHGQTENNKHHRLSGWVNTPLTEQGLADARSSAAKLTAADVTFDKIISSDLGRAVATAEIIVHALGSTTPIEKSAELREVNYGELGGKPYSDYPPLSPADNADFVPAGGESLRQMQQRVMAYVQQLSTDNPDATILLVAHDGTINAVHAAFLDESIGIVDADSANEHDAVMTFVYETDVVTSFALV